MPITAVYADEHPGQGQDTNIGGRRFIRAASPLGRGLAAMTDITLEVSWREWVRSGRWLESGDAGLPVSPAFAHQALSLARDPEVSVRHLARVISKDQVLTLRVLRLANDAPGASACPITGVTAAIVRVGTAAVRHEILGALTAPALQASRVYSGWGAPLLNQSVATAAMAALLAERTEVPVEEATACGLLHGIGCLGIRKVSLYHTSSGGPPPAEDEIETLMRDHFATIGAAIVRRYGLPAAISDSVEYQECPEKSARFGARARIVYVAKRLSLRYGFSGGAPSDDDDLLNDPGVIAFGLDRRWLAELDHRARPTFAAARALVA